MKLPLKVYLDAMRNGVFKFLQAASTEALRKVLIEAAKRDSNAVEKGEATRDIMSIPLEMGVFLQKIAEVYSRTVIAKEQSSGEEKPSSQ